MLIVLTSEQKIANEASTINLLFENGMETLHLRKPAFDIDEYKFLLRNINQVFHKNIVIHQYHTLCNEFNLKGIHLKEQLRISLGNKLQHHLNSFKNLNYNCSISSSFHETQELESCKATLDYYFLSPVFSSISKKAYKGKGFEVNHIDKNIIGLGGISIHNIAETINKGFSGIAVLGSVWANKNYLSNFLKIKNSYYSKKT